MAWTEPTDAPMSLIFLVTATLVAATPPASLTPSSVVIVGGSSGMGKAAAKQIVSRGGRVLLASRNKEKLNAARTEIIKSTNCVDVHAVETFILDASDENSMADFAASLQSNEWDGLVVSAAGAAPHGPITTLPTTDTIGLFDSKFWSAYFACKHVGPKLKDGGAIALVSGVLNRRPGINCVPLAVVNGALEGLTRALALEFGPKLRVNALSPGFCDTERFDRMDPERKAAMLANTAASLPLERTGVPSDMGQALDFLLCSPFTTGVVLDCDGGHHIRQYANVAGDPMRR